MPYSKTLTHNFKKALLYFFVAFILLIVLIPQREQLLLGVKTIPKANLTWVWLAIICLMFAYVVTAVVYKTLANKKISLFTTFFVQIATSFINRVVPAGIGGLGLNTDYLIKSGHRPIEAGSIVAVNSIVAMISHILLIVVAVLTGGISLSSLFQTNKVPIWVYIALILIFILVLLVVLNVKKWRKKIIDIKMQIINSLAVYKKKPYKLFIALMGATLLTLLYVTALWACCIALGLQITLLEAFLCYSISVLVGAALLTPGGLGGVEAGLYASLLVFNNQPILVFGAVILYRLITYWLPIIPGILCFWLLRNAKKI
jgi:uncharacterized protein (TIRG00374 family)